MLEMLEKQISIFKMKKEEIQEERKKLNTNTKKIQKAKKLISQLGIEANFNDNIEDLEKLERIENDLKTCKAVIRRCESLIKCYQEKEDTILN